MSKTGIIQVSLRLTPDVYEILKAKADENGRSLNSEAIQAIIEHCDSNSLASRLDILQRDVQELKAFVATLPPAAHVTPSKESEKP